MIPGGFQIGHRNYAESAEPAQTTAEPPTGGGSHGGKMVPSRGKRAPLVVKSLICLCKGRVTPERAGKGAHRDEPAEE